MSNCSCNLLQIYIVLWNSIVQFRHKNKILSKRTIYKQKLEHEVWRLGVR